MPVRGLLVYTDDHRAYIGLPYTHKTVKHSVREYYMDRPIPTA